MQIMICGIKPDDEGLSSQRGNGIQARASIGMVSGGQAIPLEGFKHIYKHRKRLNMRTINRIANETGTEVFSIVVMLAPKRPDDIGWLDQGTGESEFKRE